MLVLTALVTSSAAESQRELVPTVRAAEQAAVPAVEAEVKGSQVASAEECTKDCAELTAALEQRPVRIGKAHYSPIGEAVLNLLRSQGGGHLRP